MADVGASSSLFRWICLGVAVVFLSITGWMINDIRLQVRRSAGIVKTTSDGVNEHLPTVVEKSRQTTEVLSKHLPDVVEKVKLSTDTVTERLPEVVERIDRTTEVVAELAEDIRQLKQLAGVGQTQRDENLISYTNEVFRAIESSGGSVGAKKVVGSGLKNVLPAKEWVAGKRKWATLMLFKFKSKKEMVLWLCKGWYLTLPDHTIVPLIDWVSDHHPETKRVLAS